MIQTSIWTLFLDRDGVINHCKVGDYIRNWSEFEFLPNVLEALAHLKKYFKRIVLVTNQQGVGKGLMTAADLANIHQQMCAKIEQAGGWVDAVYHCPDLTKDNPFCRKPNIGMALQAKGDFPEIEFNYSVMVGDTGSDMEFGHRAGMQTVFVDNGNAALSTPEFAQARVRDLWEFAENVTRFLRKG